MVPRTVTIAQALTALVDVQLEGGRVGPAGGRLVEVGGLDREGGHPAQVFAAAVEVSTTAAGAAVTGGEVERPGRDAGEEGWGDESEC